jgi:hypothetical protein
MIGREGLTASTLTSCRTALGRSAGIVSGVFSVANVMQWYVNLVTIAGAGALGWIVLEFLGKPERNCCCWLILLLQSREKRSLPRWKSNSTTWLLKLDEKRSE